jgi:hypothetical protein
MAAKAKGHGLWAVACMPLRSPHACEQDDLSVRSWLCSSGAIYSKRVAVSLMRHPCAVICPAASKRS